MGKEVEPTHKCEEYVYCICYHLALEPDEKCPEHGWPYPPRCKCGRFVKDNRKLEVSDAD